MFQKLYNFIARWHLFDREFTRKVLIEAKIILFSGNKLFNICRTYFLNNYFSGEKVAQ